MVGNRGLESPKVVSYDISLAAAASTVEQFLDGGTLVGVSIPELTSTTFTITNASETGGTFRTIRDPFGSFGDEDTAVTFAIGTTSAGYYPVPPTLTAGLKYFKIVFDSAETATITLFVRSIE